MEQIPTLDTRYVRLIRRIADGGTCAPVEVEELPLPWEAWLLLTLVEYRRKQHWVADIVRNRLGGDLARIAKRGYEGHPTSVPRTGPVPDLPGWSYDFHGIGCCLKDEATGEYVDVDFFGDHAEGFEFSFIELNIKTVKSPKGVRRRIIELHPSIETLRFAREQVAAANVLVPIVNPPSAERPWEAAPRRLHPDIMAVEKELFAFTQAFANEAGVEVAAAVVGDWLLLEAMSERPADGLVGERCRRIRAIREQYLRQVLAGKEDRTRALEALCELPANNVVALLKDALEDEEGLALTALHIVERREDARSWGPQIYEFYERMRKEPGGRSWPWVACLRFFHKHKYRQECIGPALPTADASAAGMAARLALIYAPAWAVKLFRRALDSEYPYGRGDVAAILAGVAEPWCWRVFADVLEKTTNYEQTAEVRAAMRQAPDTRVRERAAEWERAHTAKSAGRARSIDPSAENWLAYFMGGEKRYAEVIKVWSRRYPEYVGEDAD